MTRMMDTVVIKLAIGIRIGHERLATTSLRDAAELGDVGDASPCIR